MLFPLETRLQPDDNQTREGLADIMLANFTAFYFTSLRDTHRMDTVLIMKAIILGLVEGLTEFLPISSTGHLILVGSLLDFNDEKGKLFEIVIQTGAIAAVMWEYRKKIADTVVGLGRDPIANRFFLNLLTAFLPLAILGLLFGKNIKAVLFAPVPVAMAFIVGGLLILWIERRSVHQMRPPKITSVDQLSGKDALGLGFIQALALIPGTSRSGATIMGGLVWGMSRKAAAEFSFFLAMPTLIAASLYELMKNRELLSTADIPLFVVGFSASFISAFICVRWLLRYISTHDFQLFAWYRIVFGLLILLTHHYGWVDWSH
jgi:undecaprenyl-diphosphatase